MNRVILVGNLTKDPELATTNSGVSVCRFTLAVSRRYQNADGEREIEFDYAFLGDGDYTAEIFTDGENRDTVNKTDKTVTKSSLKSSARGYMRRWRGTSTCFTRR